MRPSTRVAIVLAGFGLNQAIRLAMSIVITRLLAPQMMGVMVIVNTIRTGVELFTDIGIGANIVRHQDGRLPDFLRTAWTVQVLRGIILTGAGLAIAPLIAAAYQNDQLLGLLLIASVAFLFSGFRWISLFVLQKEQQVLPRVMFDIITNIIFSIISVFLAWWLRSAWALVIALLVGEVILTAASFLININVNPKFKIDHKYLKDIVGFGKWIFLGSVLYFATLSFDKFYFSTALSLFFLGVYGVGRTLSDAVGQAIIYLGEFIVFPAISGFKGSHDELMRRLTSARRRMLILAALGLSSITAAGPSLVMLLYDDRYRAAALIAPALLLSIWPNLLSVVSEMILRGLGRSAPGAIGNAFKLAGLAIGLPVGFITGGIEGALIAIILAEWLRYFSIAAICNRHNINFLKMDMSFTGIFIILVIIMFSLINVFCLGIGLEKFIEWGRTLHNS